MKSDISKKLDDHFTRLAQLISARPPHVTHIHLHTNGTSADDNTITPNVSPEVVGRVAPVMQPLASYLRRRRPRELAVNAGRTADDQQAEPLNRHPRPYTS
jgi:hypothetical protein